MPTPDHLSPERTHRAQRRSGGARLAVALSIPVAVVASGALVWQASYAAFTAQTTNPGNSWSTGTVVLSDTAGGPASGTALFSPTGLDGGDTGSACITVGYTGSLASQVVMTAADPVGDDTLAPYLDVVVEAATGALPGTCAAFTGTAVFTGTLADLKTAFVTGQDAWTTDASATSTEQRTYKVTWTVQNANAAQGTTTGVDLVWTATAQ